MYPDLEIEVTSSALRDVPVDISVIDYRALSGDLTIRAAALRQLDESFKTYGFIYLSNHSIPTKLVDEAFQWVCKFPSIISYQA